MKNRINWIDYAKGLAIIGVVFVHAHGMPDELKKIIYVALIPIFFFLSGIFASKELSLSTADFLKRKSRQLIIPYLFFNCITYLFWLLLGRHFGSDANSVIDPIQPLYGILSGNAIHLIHYVPLWFLTCMFSTVVIYFFLFRKAHRLSTQIVLLFGTLIGGYFTSKYLSVELPWGLNNLLPMMFFYGLGHLYGAHKESFKQMPNQLKIGLSLIGLIGLFIAFNYNNTIAIHKAFYGQYILFLIGAISGIILLVTGTKLISKLHKNDVILSFIGQNTLIILCLHLIAGSVLKAITLFILKLPLTVFDNLIGALIYSCLSIFILWPIIWFINSYLPFLVGRPSK